MEPPAAKKPKKLAAGLAAGARKPAALAAGASKPAAASAPKPKAKKKTKPKANPKGPNFNYAGCADFARALRQERSESSPHSRAGRFDPASSVRRGRSGFRSVARARARLSLSL